MNKVDSSPLIRWLASVALVWSVAAGCDSNPTPHPGQPEVYPDTTPPNTDPEDDRDPNGDDASELVPDGDMTAGTDNLFCDAHADGETFDGGDITPDAPDAGPTDGGPTDTSPDANPCAPASRGAAENDSDFATPPVPTGPP